MTLVYFNEEQIARCFTASELSNILTQIYRNFEPNNPVIRIVHSNGNMLEVGISTDGCYANFKSASLDPPYYSSIGNNTEQDGIVEYQMTKKGHVSEIPIENTVSFDGLLEIAIEFHQSGQLPTSAVEWEID